MRECRCLHISYKMIRHEPATCDLVRVYSWRSSKSGTVTKDIMASFVCFIGFVFRDDVDFGC